MIEISTLTIQGMNDIRGIYSPGGSTPNSLVVGLMDGIADERGYTLHNGKYHDLNELDVAARIDWFFTNVHKLDDATAYRKLLEWLKHTEPDEDVWHQLFSYLNDVEY